MALNHKFGANCDQRFYQTTGRASRRPLQAGGALVPAFVITGLVIATMTAVAARATIVSIAPATASVYASVGLPVNLLGLSIAKVHATIAQQTEGPGELVISGEIENLHGAKTSAPNLRLALRGEDGREIYAWTAKGPKSSLDAHERVAFRARLAAPPAGVRDVLVKFAEPGNKGAFTETPS
jgi:hypothetical protein